MWMRKRRVRVHMEGQTASLEGILVGRWDNSYVLRVPEMITAPGSTQTLEGRDVRIPRERVLFLQSL